MFVQIIQGYVDDPAPVHQAMQTWVRDLAPGAVGWLGSTGGVTDDGRFIALARFSSADAARANSDRPEQGKWWAQTAGLFTKEVTFTDSTDVVVDLSGDPETAGFVQVMHGRGRDTERARAVMGQHADAWAAFRPEILGKVQVFHADDVWTMAIYFTSEQAAREGEAKEPPQVIKEQMEQMNAMVVGVPEFYDLKDPWLYSAS